jgi:acyl-CoA thioester hydrolase
VTRKSAIKQVLPQLSDYKYRISLDTRWMDNDLYGHVNNVVYYSYFDTIVNRFLIEHANLDIHNGNEIGLMVNSQCDYYSSIAFPDKLIGALGVNRIGNTSVQYNIAIFREQQQTASASGIMTHVFVDRSSNKPVPITGDLKQALSQALLGNSK